MVCSPSKQQIWVNIVDVFFCLFVWFFLPFSVLHWSWVRPAPPTAALSNRSCQSASSAADVANIDGTLENWLKRDLRVSKHAGSWGPGKSPKYSSPDRHQLAIKRLRTLTCPAVTNQSTPEKVFIVLNKWYYFSAFIYLGNKYSCIAMVSLNFQCDFRKPVWATVPERSLQ